LQDATGAGFTLSCSACSALDEQLEELDEPGLLAAATANSVPARSIHRQRMD
tara:strand:+ start:714 stop:869 length:156 start_codon:yes stop_codon:yes gene_type:complete